MRLCLFGAAGDTPNLGVSALMISALTAIHAAEPDAQITVFDNGWGLRPGQVALGSTDLPVQYCGARNSKRLHRPESLWNIRFSARLGLPFNPGARALRNADAVLDVSGGDSFADLYGPKRFRAMTLPKQIALELGRPLVLLPQTYGPFTDAGSRRLAHSLVTASTLAWARCPRSFAALKELLGGDFDPLRHKEGIDMAFAMREAEPQVPLEPSLQQWLARPRAHEVVGFNVSGLVYNDPNSAGKYGFRTDYQALVEAFLARLLEASDARILFVPHVVAKEGELESDGRAARVLAQKLMARGPGRIAIAPENLNAREAKWLIARTDWFCGTRMHATIAALSSGVPTAAIAYSLKTLGVFETCGQGAHVAEARTLDSAEALEVLWASWNNRRQAQAELQVRAPGMRERAHQQMAATLAQAIGGQNRLTRKALA